MILRKNNDVCGKKDVFKNWKRLDLNRSFFRKLSFFPESFYFHQLSK